ncbi:MAG: hypothetical protein AB7O96_01120 [Pseudobdellovibrionaceae bacterium]|nr:hypothetical protein [Halobacteriovoraceae bacterium]
MIQIKTEKQFEELTDKNFNLLRIFYIKWQNKYDSEISPPMISENINLLNAGTSIIGNVPVYRPKNINDWIFLSRMCLNNERNQFIVTKLCGVYCSMYGGNPNPTKQKDGEKKYFGPLEGTSDAQTKIVTAHRSEIQEDIGTYVLFRFMYGEKIDMLKCNVKVPVYDKIAQRLAQCNISHVKIALNNEMPTHYADSNLFHLCGAIPAIFIGETSRFSFSLPIALMLLDLIENEFKYGKNSEKQMNVSDIFGKKPLDDPKYFSEHSVIDQGQSGKGKHPMCFQGSVKQANNANDFLNNTQKRTVDQSIVNIFSGNRVLKKCIKIISQWTKSKQLEQKSVDEIANDFEKRIQYLI